jgi:serine/threonine protein kinase
MPISFDDCGIKRELTCDFKNLLSEGSYGRVYKCTHKDPKTGQLSHYVIKHAKSKGGVDEEIKYAKEMDRRCGLLSFEIKYTKYVVPMFTTNKRDTVAIARARVLSDLKSEVLDPDMFLRLTEELPKAVTHIHTQLKMAHNDIKPDNVGFVDDDIKLLDIGMMRNVNETTDQSEGTPAYRAPSGCDTDMWAVGCTLFEMLTNSFMSIYWAEDPDIHEFATVVIMEDVANIYKMELIRYLMNKSATELNMSAFKEESLMENHASLVKNNLKSLRNKFRMGLKTLAANSGAPDYAEIVTNNIYACFENSCKRAMSGGGYKPILKQPVRLRRL